MLIFNSFSVSLSDTEKLTHGRTLCAVCIMLFWVNSGLSSMGQWRLSTTGSSFLSFLTLNNLPEFSAYKYCYRKGCIVIFPCHLD